MAQSRGRSAAQGHAPFAQELDFSQGQLLVVGRALGGASRDLCRVCRKTCAGCCRPVPNSGAGRRPTQANAEIIVGTRC